ncbi:hypothetical protein EN873_32955 [bacterium M00.F.Ca.ET.230.01.1.1]|nr:hypothetical protein EN873_32955 [bacterium M00.F.Ca.ET.230.01.1.1]
MPNLASSPHHTLLLLTGLALTGFLALTYLAFHQPISVLAANAITVTSDTMVSHHQSHHPLSHPNSHQNQQLKQHNHQADGESANSPSQNAIFKSKSAAKSPVPSEQNSRLVDALLVMGGIGCH